MRKNILRFVKACCLLEFNLVLLFRREMIKNVCMLGLMLFMNLLIKIVVKITNIIFLFFQTMSVVIGQCIIMMNSNYRDMVKSSRKVQINN
jgi:hypothetical protein